MRTHAGALCVAALLFVCLALTWAIPELVPAARTIDFAVLGDFASLRGGRVLYGTHNLLHLLEDRALFAVWCLLLIMTATIRGRPRVAVTIALILVLAPLSSEVLKASLAHSYDRPHALQPGRSTWPSATSAAAVAVVLCGILAAPRTLRVPLASAGCLFAGAVGASLLIRQAHTPSDVLGGYLMGALWTTLAVAGLGAADRRFPRPSASASPRQSGGQASS